MGKGLDKLGIFAIKHRTNKLGDEDLGKFSAGDGLLCQWVVPHGVEELPTPRDHGISLPFGRRQWSLDWIRQAGNPVLMASGPLLQVQNGLNKNNEVYSSASFHPPRLAHGMAKLLG